MRTVLFVGALLAAGLAITGKIKMSYGIGGGIALLIIANLIPESSTQAG